MILNFILYIFRIYDSICYFYLLHEFNTLIFYLISRNLKKYFLILNKFVIIILYCRSIRGKFSQSLYLFHIRHFYLTHIQLKLHFELNNSK